MIAKRGALLLAIVILTFVSISLVANLISGTNISSVIGSVYSNNAKTIVTTTPADVTKCKCSFNNDYQTNTCSNGCGDLSGAACNTVNDCLV